MQLSDILEEHSAKGISKKTNISEENIEYLLKKEFEKLDKVKAVGFISILEREFDADLGPLRDEVHEYYTENHQGDKGVTVGYPFVEDKKGKSKWFIFFVFVALVYATWYFLTQYGKTHFNTLIPAVEEVSSQTTMDTEKIEDKDLSIINVIKHKWQDITQDQGTEINHIQSEKNEVTIEKTAVIQVDEPVSKNVPDKEETVEVQEIQSDTEKVLVEETLPAAQVVEEQTLAGAHVEVKSIDLPQSEKAIEEEKTVSIIPAKRLWFGVIDLETKKREHFTVSSKHDLKIKQEGLLAATSSASFTLVDGEKNHSFNDAKEHYFKVDQSGIKEMTKEEYVASGGWSQW